MRRRERPAVEQAQAVAQRAHAAPRRPGPEGARDGRGTGAHGAPRRVSGRLQVLRFALASRHREHSPSGSLSCRRRDGSRPAACPGSEAGGTAPGACRQGKTSEVPQCVQRCSHAASSSAAAPCWPGSLPAPRRTAATLDRDRAKVIRHRQPDPRPPRAAAAAGEPPARPRRRATHTGDMLARRLLRPLVDDGTAMARACVATPGRLDRRDHRRTSAAARAARARRADVDAVAAPPGLPALAARAAASASASARGRLGQRARSRSSRPIFASPPLTGPRGGGRTRLRPAWPARPASTRRSSATG